MVAPMVWDRFGQVDNYVEPFFGSGAVLLGRPEPFGIETVNDKDGYLSNFWRAVQDDPEATAHWADWPVNENDLHARHAYLVAAKSDFVAKLEGDPEFYDVKIAGWWVWGICCWIGSGWCSGQGPWSVVDGKLVKCVNWQGVNRQLVHLGSAGMGVHRKRVHLGNAGLGVHRKRVLGSWFQELSDRLRRVRVCSGDWLRVLGPTPTVKLGITGVFLDPPYSLEAGRDENLYTEEDLGVAHNVREWAIEHGSDRRMRIALCGYEGEHTMPGDWECVEWKTNGGYGSQGDGEARENSTRERIWFSPHCLKQPTLFKEDYDRTLQAPAGLSGLQRDH